MIPNLCCKYTQRRSRKARQETKHERRWDHLRRIWGDRLVRNLTCFLAVRNWLQRIILDSPFKEERYFQFQIKMCWSFKEFHQDLSLQVVMSRVQRDSFMMQVFFLPSDRLNWNQMWPKKPQHLIHFIWNLYSPWFHWRQYLHMHRLLGTEPGRWSR